MRDTLDLVASLLPRDAVRQRDLEELALADVGDPGVPEAVQRRADRLTLRVEYGGFQRYENASFHGKSDYLTRTAPNVLFGTT
jgi:hypothetical protein